MDYIIKIKSESDNLIIIDKFINKVVKKNTFITLLLNIEENENFIVNVEPIEKKNNINLPYKIFVENVNNKLNFLSNNIEALNFENKYILTIKNLVTLKDMQIVSQTDDYLIFNTFTTNIKIKNNTHTLPKTFILKESKKIGSNTLLLFETSTHNAEENFTPYEIEKYVVVLNNNEIIFKDFFTQINLDGKIEILSPLYDIAKHAIITNIENNKVNQKTIYLNNKPILTNSPNLIPLAFLQALKIDNIKLCQYYLSDNLKEIASLKTLKSYFKDYKKVEFDNNRYVLFYSDFTYKIFEYELINNKISKINIK